MALNTYFGNDLHTLSAHLAKELREQRHLFVKNFIITGHQTTNDFLVESIAQTNGIAANLAFVRPLELVEILYKVLELPSEKQLLKPHQPVWLLENELKEACRQNIPEIETIRHYIAEDAHKRFTLAEQIIHLFQSYQENSPEIITTWNNNEAYSRPDIKPEDEAWQRYLWQSLKKHPDNPFPDLTVVYEAINNALRSEEKTHLLKEKMPFIALFGYLPYSPELINLVQLLGEWIHVSIYYQHFEAAENSRFLKNFGSLAKRHVELLEPLPKVQIDGINATHNASVLHRLQHHIKHPNPDAEKVAADDSITVSSSFTISREVEALYHYLIGLFELDGTLMKRDVCVITPDVESYAPAIEAFFGKSDLPLDYTLYDTSHKIQTSPYAALEALLQMEKQAFTSKKVLSLLEFQYIRDSFGISEDLNTLLTAVEKANIRIGYEGEKTNETEYISWQYGLKRLIYGACLPPFLDNTEINGTVFFPVDEFEEKKVFQLMLLQSFSQRLNAWMEEREKPRIINEWVNFIENETLDVFIDFASYEVNKLKRILGDLTEVGAWHHVPVSFYTFRYYLLNRLDGIEGGKRKGHGGIRFIAPSAFLSSPAKVYAFLGMNGKDFPRFANRLSFDLSRPDCLTGTDMDKNLFLNILLSAQNKVYISYIGQSVKNNAVIPASTLVEDLLDELRQVVADLDPEKYIIRHPLHAFNSKYNQAIYPGLIQYRSSGKKNTLQNSLLLPRAQNAFEWEEVDGKKVIDMHALKRFMEDPARHFFNKVLGIYYRNENDKVSEQEVFKLDDIGKWSVRNELLQAKYKGEDPDTTEIVNRLKMTGRLPLANAGLFAFQEAVTEMEKMFANTMFNNLLQIPKKEVRHADVVVGDYILRGKLDHLYDHQFAYISASKNKPKYQLFALLEFYFACLADESVTELFFLPYNIEHGKVLPRPEKEDILDKLKECCTLFEEGTEHAINFWIDFTEEKVPVEDTELFLEKLEKKLAESERGDYQFTSAYFEKLKELQPFSIPCHLDSFIRMYETVQSFVTPLNL